MRAWLVVLLLALAGCTTDSPSEVDRDITVSPSNEDADPEASTIRAVPISDESFEWEPSGAVNPVDPLHYVVAYRHNSHATMSVRTTFDGGESWHDANVPITASTGPAAEWSHNGDPVVFFSPDGDLYIGGIGGPERGASPTGDEIRYGRSIFIVTSPDGGLGFSEPIVVAEGGGSSTDMGGVQHSDDYVNQDRPWFAAGADGVVLAAWNELGHAGPRTTVAGQSTVAYDGNEFQYAISRDAGATWTEPATLAEGGWPGALVRGDGSFVLGHSSHVTGKVSLFKSADGVTWEKQEIGVGLDAAMVTEYEGDILISTSGVLDGNRLPAYYRVGQEVAGPFMYASGQDAPPSNHIAVDPRGGFWSMWLGGNGTVNLARFTEDTMPWPAERHVIAEIAPDLAAYGHYVYTLDVSDRLYIVWNDIVGDDRQLYVSVY